MEEGFHPGSSRWTLSRLYRLIDLVRHYELPSKSLSAIYRAKTKGKAERPFLSIREDFFLAGSFRNLADLNEQLRHWLDRVANPRLRRRGGSSMRPSPRRNRLARRCRWRRFERNRCGGTTYKFWPRQNKLGEVRLRQFARCMVQAVSVTWKVRKP